MIKLTIDIDYSQAACADVEDAEIFFPDGGKHHMQMVAAAKAICADCPVMLQCLEHGLRHEKIGIWGGMTPGERQEIRRRRKIVLIPLDIE